MVDKNYCFKIDGSCPHRISRTKKQCFIIMAYDQCYSNIIESIFRNAIKEVYGLDPILSKDIKHRGSSDMFCTKVCRPIQQATLCIADLTYNNTNVGYEIAIAQKFNKPVIITRYTATGNSLTDADKITLDDFAGRGIIQFSYLPNKIASDIQGIFRIDYTSEKELKQKLKDEFKIN